jgi:hypothetical protein
MAGALFSSERVMRTFLSLLAFALAINIVFAGLTYLFFHGQIRGAKTFVDYLHYAIGSLTTAEVAGMIPETAGVKLWTSLYILTAWVYFIYLAIHHFTSIRFG